MRLATLQKTSSYVCFYGSPRHNSSTHTPPSSSSLVEWAGPLLFFPFDSRARERLSTREEAVVATNLREHKVFANTSPLTLANARAVEDICPGLCTPVSLPPSFAPILSHEQKGGKKEGEKKRQRGSEIKRWRERERIASQGHNPSYTGRRHRQGLSAGSRVSSLAASRNSVKTGPFLLVLVLVLRGNTHDVEIHTCR